HVDGRPARSCTLALSAVGNARITTSEHLADDAVGKAVLDAWLRHDVAQCGYCQSGQMMSAAGLLRGNKAPTDADIDRAMAGNLCRCATYQRIRAAIHDAARALA
ncbi:2Fe-2S iron-sulfur cluster-binding protein, partial [Paenibacillus macerans]|nr:2Fe-2S iron-sulfur cluster-binding protein [Paenibacillus macerans]